MNYTKSLFTVNLTIVPNKGKNAKHNHLLSNAVNNNINVNSCRGRTYLTGGAEEEEEKILEGETGHQHVDLVMTAADTHHHHERYHDAHDGDTEE